MTCCMTCQQLFLYRHCTSKFWHCHAEKLPTSIVPQSTHKLHLCVGHFLLQETRFQAVVWNLILTVKGSATSAHTWYRREGWIHLMNHTVLPSRGIKFYIPGLGKLIGLYCKKLYGEDREEPCHAHSGVPCSLLAPAPLGKIFLALQELHSWCRSARDSTTSGAWTTAAGCCKQSSGLWQ